MPVLRSVADQCVQVSQILRIQWAITFVGYNGHCKLGRPDLYRHSQSMYRASPMRYHLPVMHVRKKPRTGSVRSLSVQMR